MPKVDYSRWRLDENRGDPWAEDPQFPRSDWGAEAEANNTNLGYWEWVYSSRLEAVPEGGGETVPDASKDDVLRAIANHQEAEAQLNRLATELINEGDPIFWYTQRGRNHHRQDGVVLRCNNVDHGGRAIMVRNDRTEKEFFISLYDLRFWLNDVHPENQ